MNLASLLLVCVFSVDRFVAVYFPLERTRLLTQTCFMTLCLISWFLPAISSAYPLFRSGHFYYFPVLGYYITHITYSGPLEEDLLFIFSNTIATAPFILTVALCTAVMVRLRKSVRSSPCLRRRRFRSGVSKTIAAVTRTTVSATRTTTVSARSTGASVSQTQKGELGSTGVNGSQVSRKGLSFKSNIKPVSTVIKPFSADIAPQSSNIVPETTGIIEPHSTDNDILPQGACIMPEGNYSKRSAKGRSFPAKFKSCSISRNTSIVVLKIIGLYIICLLPGTLINVYNMLDALGVLPVAISVATIIGNDCLLTMYLYMSLVFSTLLFTLNSCVNPYVYFFRSRMNFRYSLKRFFKRRNSCGFRLKS